ILFARDYEPLTTDKRAAGGVLTAKQAPRRPGTAPALGLRAGEVAAMLSSRPPPLKGIQRLEEVCSCLSTTRFVRCSICDHAAGVLALDPVVGFQTGGWSLNHWRTAAYRPAPFHWHRAQPPRNWSASGSSGPPRLLTAGRCPSTSSAPRPMAA